MNRKDFFKNIGLGLGVAILAPQMMFADDIYPNEYVLPEFPGQYGETFELKLNRVYKCADILTNDPEFGCQVIVVSVEQNNHTVKLVTNDPKSYFPRHWLNKGTKLYRIWHNGEEYGTLTSGYMSVEDSLKNEHEPKYALIV